MKQTKTIKCPVCGDLKNINFGEEKILRLKEHSHNAKIIADQNYANCRQSWKKVHEVEKVISNLEKLKSKTIREVYAYLKEIEVKSKSMKSML